MRPEIRDLKNLIHEYEQLQKKEQQLTSWIEGMDSGTIEPRIGWSRKTGILNSDDEGLMEGVKDVMIPFFKRERGEVQKKIETIVKDILGE